MNTFDILERLVSQTTCKPGWRFALITEEDALSLIITVSGVDAYDENSSFTVNHHHRVPIATYNEKTWRRWLFEQCIKTETHELAEWFKINGMRPFPPTHGPGEDPYAFHDYRDLADSKILQNGSVMGEENGNLRSGEEHLEPCGEGNTTSAKGKGK